VVRDTDKARESELVLARLLLRSRLTSSRSKASSSFMAAFAFVNMTKTYQQSVRLAIHCDDYWR
jgi:hypothetical protein